MTEKSLPRDILTKLRTEGIINSNEIVLQVGDLLVAENVINRERRVLGEKSSIINEGKRILKG